MIVDESLTIRDPLPPVAAHPGARAPVPRLDTPPGPPGLVVPVGEFDSRVRGVSGSTQATVKRDAIDAVLNIAGSADLHGDPTLIDPYTEELDRAHSMLDGTGGGASERTRGSGGTLRASAALRRKRGIYGDVRYVFTALFGAREARREVAELEHRQQLRQTSRRRHLVTLGRTAVIADSFEHAAMSRARDALHATEDERAKHAGAVAASDAELDRVRRDRDAKLKVYLDQVEATDKELAELGRKLEPLEKQAASARKRAQDLREALQRADKRIADTEALFTSVKGEKMDKAQIEAELATHKADRTSVLRDEPVIAAELDALEPRIAAMQATRVELRKKRGDLDKNETEDHRRAMELLEAIGAKRKVVERAAADAETARDAALFELGERLYVDRPRTLNAQLAPIDEIDFESGEAERRIMELREILSNIDKAKFARGATIIVLGLSLVGLLVFWIARALH